MTDWAYDEAAEAWTSQRAKISSLGAGHCLYVDEMDTLPPLVEARSEIDRLTGENERLLRLLDFGLGGWQDAHLDGGEGVRVDLDAGCWVSIDDPGFEEYMPIEPEDLALLSSVICGRGRTTEDAR